MRRMLPILLLLASCGDDRPTAPTSEQADQLNEAENMLNDIADEKGPEDFSSDPVSNQ